LNLQPPGSEPGVLPVELSLSQRSVLLHRCMGETPMTRIGRRLDSNQHPQAYETCARPLSYAPVIAQYIRAVGWHRTSDRPLTRRLLCQTELPRHERGQVVRQESEPHGPGPRIGRDFQEHRAGVEPARSTLARSRSAVELPVRVREMWTLGIEPRRRVLQTRALPIELSPRGKE
jgi:hypothetical protein